MAEINTVTENNETRGPLTVVATITAGEGQAEAVEAALRTAVAEVTGEPGCEGYTLHADTENPQVFMMFERWSSLQALVHHSEAAPFRRLVSALEGRATLSVATSRPLC